MVEQDPAALRRINHVMERAALLELADAAVAAALERLRNAIALSYDRVVEVIEIAIQHGAPIYNAGFHDVCATIYAHAARDLDALILRRDPGLEALDFTRDALAIPLAEMSEISEQNDTAAAWAFRHGFDEVVFYRIVDAGRSAVDEVLIGTRAREELLLSIPIQVIFESIRYGHLLFRERCMQGIVALHGHTATALLTLVRERRFWPPGAAEPIIEEIEGLLAPLAMKPGDPRVEPEAQAWQLYQTFLQIMVIEERAILEFLSRAVAIAEFEQIAFLCGLAAPEVGSDIAQPQRAAALIKSAKESNDVGFQRLWELTEKVVRRVSDH